jgi:hypothetical protein
MAYRVTLEIYFLRLLILQGNLDAPFQQKSLHGIEFMLSMFFSI